MENMIKEIISYNIMQTLSKTSNLSQDAYSIYDRISMDLNIRGIPNKIINLNDLYGELNYYLMLIKELENNEYYLVDLDSTEKVIKINDVLLSSYLQNFGINNHLTLDEIYEKRTNSI